MAPQPEAGHGCAVRPKLRAELLGCLLVDLERALILEDDAVCITRELDRREVVENVLANQLGIALEGITETGAARNADLEPVAGLAVHVGHERVEGLFAG